MNKKRNRLYQFFLGFLIVGSFLLFPIATRNQAPPDSVLINIVTGESDTDAEGDDDGFEPPEIADLIGEFVERDRHGR